MWTLKRALRYISRKKGKTIILFILLFVTGTFVLSALIVEKGVNAAQRELRESLGGSFSVSVKYSDDNPYYHEEIMEDSAGFSDVLLYSTKLISADFINKILKIPGVKSCEARTEALCQLEGMKLKAGTIPIEEEFENQQKMVAVYSSKDCSEFADRSLNLVAGRHIVPGDRHVILLSKTITELNHLEPGDKLQIVDTDNQKVEVELIGIFDVDTIEKTGASVTTYDRIENREYSDLTTLTEIENNSYPAGYDQVFVTASDPDQLEEIVGTVRQMDGYDEQAYEIDMHDEKYQASAGALGKAETMIKVFLALSIVVSAVILTLVLVMWNRERIHETGIYLGCGIRKSRILFQYLLEVLLIASIAFAGACIPGKIAADHIGGYIVAEKKTQEDTESLIDTLENSEDENLLADTAESLEMEMKVGEKEIVILYMIGMFIVVFSVVVSSSCIFRLKPREVLSKMS